MTTSSKTSTATKQRVNIIACGALAKELLAIKKINQWQHFNIECLPAIYHASPELIPDAVEEKITQIHAQNSEEILIAYGDCGTGGKLDRVISKNIKKGIKVSRLPGAHCYQFFAGNEVFNALHEADIGCFYLTDFLTQHFDTYVWKMLGLDRKPELLDLYFAHYNKVIFLAQTDNPELTKKAKQAANRLGLTFERIFTAYGDMESSLQNTEYHVSIETLSSTKQCNNH